MNPRTFDFHVTAIDRALLGLLEERARLMAELAPHAARPADLDELAARSCGVLSFEGLCAVFAAIHTATTEASEGTR